VPRLARVFDEGRIEFVIWSIPATLTVMLHWKEISDAIAPSLEARTKVAARPSRLKSKAGPAERHPGVLWKPQRFVQVVGFATANFAPPLSHFLLRDQTSWKRSA
jgi:hypothetical protein